MNRKPLIALNADYRSAKGDSPAFSYVQAGYYDSIVKAGGIPFLLPPIADEKDIIIERGANPDETGTCITSGAPIAIILGNGGGADIRNADICGDIIVEANTTFRVDDGGGAIKGNITARILSLVLIKDRSGLGDGRLTTFDGKLTCSQGAQAYFSNVQCGQTCSGAIPGSCVF